MTIVLPQIKTFYSNVRVFLHNQINKCETVFFKKCLTVCEEHRSSNWPKSKWTRKKQKSSPTANEEMMKKYLPL